MSLDIGSRCSFPSCGTIDFLPILCRCNKHYCRYHAVPELHSCPADPSEQQPLAPLREVLPCCVPGCKRPCATESTQVEQARTTYRFAEPYCIVWVVHRPSEYYAHGQRTTATEYPHHDSVPSLQAKRKRLQTILEMLVPFWPNTSLEAVCRIRSDVDKREEMCLQIVFC